MSQPYIGEIRLFAGNFAPRDWMFCDGTLLPISQYDVLFSLIGTTYGGDGQSTFALPDLRGRAIVHQGAGFAMGESAGSETVTLVGQQMPAHGHAVLATTGTGNAGAPDPTVMLAAAPAGEPVYDTATTSLVNLAPGAVGPAGGSQPHENRQPYLAINYIISLYGIYPSQS